MVVKSAWVEGSVDKASCSVEESFVLSIVRCIGGDSCFVGSLSTLI